MADNMEIERKFLPLSIPDNLDSYPHKHYRQAYLCTEPVVRIRMEGSDYVLTYKGAGLISHPEYNLPLTEESFNHLLKKCDGRIIDKVRYVLPVPGYDKLHAELDVFEGQLSGLVMLEVEFDSEQEAKDFTPPSWYGKDVTDDPHYHNSYLSKE